MKLPKNTHLEPCFWSYRFADLDTKTHQNLIIKQVLEYGDQVATDWLQETYTKEEMAAVVSSSLVSEWSKKTRNYLKVIFGLEPQRSSRVT